MRINCRVCRGKARIASRNELSVDYTNLYCICLEPGCGHQFVMNLAFSHTTRPAASAVDQLLFDRLQSLPRDQQRELFAQLGAAASA